MKNLSFAGLGLLALTLASCAPAQGQKPMRYQATSAQILSAIAEIAPTVQASPAHNFYSVTAVTPTQVTLQAATTAGFQAFGANVPIEVTFTALESGNTTLVTHALRTEVKVTPSSPAGRAIENIYSELARRFPLAP